MRVTISNNNLVRFQMQDVGGGKSVGTVTFNDPEYMNRMTEAMAQDFRNIVGDARPSAIVVTGEGGRFSAGGDMDMFRQKQRQSTELNSREMLAFYGSFLGILDFDIPIIAAINGHAIGAGLCFACACDQRIAADTIVADGAEILLGFSFDTLCRVCEENGRAKEAQFAMMFFHQHFGSERLPWDLYLIPFQCVRRQRSFVHLR